MSFKMKPKTKETLIETIKDLKNLVVILENAVNDETPLSDISRKLNITPQKMQKLMQRYFRPSQLWELDQLDHYEIIKSCQGPLERCLIDILNLKYDITIWLSDAEKVRMLDIMRKTLKPRNYDLVLKFYGYNIDPAIKQHTYASLASELQLSRERIRQIVTDSLDRLRTPNVLGQILIDDYTERYGDTKIKIATKLTKEYENTVKHIIADTIKRLDIATNCLDLSVRTHNCLKRAEIHTLDALFQKSESDFLSMRNLGRGSLEELKELFRQHEVEWKNQ